MKNIKNNYFISCIQATKFTNRRKAHSLCRSIAEEELTFKDGAPLGSLMIAIEDGDTKRKIRRIVEKRVYKEYWRSHRNSAIQDNKHRAASMKYVSCVTQRSSVVL